MNHAHIADKREEFGQFIDNLWQGSKPLVKLFRTDTRGYLYDTGTNRILACGSTEFDMLNNLMKMDTKAALDLTFTSCQPAQFIKALDTIRAAIEDKNVLKTGRRIRFGLSSHFTNLDELIKKSLGMIQLEVTERCNLRCAYCLYNPSFPEKRNHGTLDMRLHTAKRAIYYLATCSSNLKEVAVTFYGGEPLIRFPLIQECVKYAHRTIRDAKVGFSITTNGTLLTDKIVTYLASEGFSIHLSLDGPKAIHDEYRKDGKGVGSFKRTIVGLRRLYDAYGSEKRKISLSIVYAPPFSAEKIDEIAELWNDYPWLLKDIPMSISYAIGFHPDQAEHQGPDSADMSFFEWARERYIECSKKHSPPHPLATSFLEKQLAIIAQREVLTEPGNMYHLNGCCLPGVRKVFVSAGGKYFVCERIFAAPSIGNVETGVDLGNLKEVYVKLVCGGELTAVFELLGSSAMFYLLCSCFQRKQTGYKFQEQKLLGSS